MTDIGPIGAASFICGDWGTSHLRLFLCDVQGMVLDTEIARCKRRTLDFERQRSTIDTTLSCTSTTVAHVISLDRRAASACLRNSILIVADHIVHR